MAVGIGGRLIRQHLDVPELRDRDTQCRWARLARCCSGTYEQVPYDRYQSRDSAAARHELVGLQQVGGFAIPHLQCLTENKIRATKAIATKTTPEPAMNLLAILSLVGVVTYVRLTGLSFNVWGPPSGKS